MSAIKQFKKSNMAVTMQFHWFPKLTFVKGALHPITNSTTIQNMTERHTQIMTKHSTMTQYFQSFEHLHLKLYILDSELIKMAVKSYHSNHKFKPLAKPYSNTISENWEV